MSKKDSKEWEAGYICAVAEIIRQHGEITIARDVLRCACPSGDVIKYGHPNDIEPLRDCGIMKAKEGGK